MEPYLRTPAVILAALIVDYFLQELFTVAGYDEIALVFTLVFLALVGCLCTWTYARYSGRMRELAAKIDKVANCIWNMFSSLK
uniref:Uncharacterized protein n=1 Tax=Steinernema glaseri TaxID=37863 RepID=A0A1I7ZXQ4_9BILA